MLIRKLVVAATLAAAGAAAHAGAMSTGAGGKDVGNLADGIFGSKMYVSPGSQASPVAAPVIAVVSPGSSANQNAPVGGSAADFVPMPAVIPAIGTPAAAAPIDPALGLVTPMAEVPEPASMALMLVGMMGVGALRRRKQQR
jgi:hypothetical protein